MSGTVLRSSPSETETQNSESRYKKPDDARYDARSPPPKNKRSYSTSNRTVVSTNSTLKYNGRISTNNDRRQPTTFNKPRMNNQGTGDGGGFGPAFKLENPKKLSRIVNEVPGSNADLFDAVSSGPRQQQRPDGGQQQRRGPSGGDDFRKRSPPNRDQSGPGTRARVDKGGEYISGTTDEVYDCFRICRFVFLKCHVFYFNRFLC